MFCLQRKVEEKFQLGRYDVLIFMICTLIVEIGLAFVAYSMMKDIDVKAAKVESKIKGGAPTGHIRGAILGGVDLRSAEHHAIMKKKKLSRTKKPKKQARTISHRQYTRNPRDLLLTSQALARGLACDLGWICFLTDCV